MSDSADVPLLTTSEIKVLDRCPQAWWWGYRCGLRPIARPADALWFGIGVHVALAEWYGMGYERGPHPADTFAEWVGDEVREIKGNLTDRDKQWFDEPAYYDAKELGISMLEGYTDLYGYDPKWEIIAIEQPFQVELVRGGRTVAIFAGAIDGALIDHSDGYIYLLENKTAGAIKTVHLPLDSQAGGYFSAGTTVLRHQGVIGPKDTLHGVMYNFLRKSMPDKRPTNEGGASLNKDQTVSKRQPPKRYLREPIDRSPREVQSILRRITEKAIIAEKYRTGELEITKNITDMCPYCPFYNMCLLHERGGNGWKAFRDQQYRTEDPYYEQLEKGKSASE